MLGTVGRSLLLPFLAERVSYKNWSPPPIFSSPSTRPPAPPLPSPHAPARHTVPEPLLQIFDPASEATVQTHLLTPANPFQAPTAESQARDRLPNRHFSHLRSPSTAPQRRPSQLAYVFAPKERFPTRPSPRAAIISQYTET